MSRTLIYFNLNGLAEGIRYILQYTGNKFEDVRVDINTWPVKEIKDSLLPFGQFPLLQEDGRVLNQSIAIARYIASGTELLPTDPWELVPNYVMFIAKSTKIMLSFQLSWSDFIFVGLIEFANLFLKDNIEKNYPKIKELVEKIPALPGVKDYVATRKPYVAW